MEYFFESYLRSFEKNDLIAFDIGANHGIYTGFLAQRFKKVYAFEPHPENMRILKERTSGHSNIEYVEKAISDTSGSTFLFTSGNPGGHSISEVVAIEGKWGHSIDCHIRVNTITLDDFCKENSVLPDIMKVDIEGAENFIFREATKVLKKSDIQILLEVHKTVDNELLFAFFKRNGFNVFNSHKNQVSGLCHNEHYVILRGDI